MRYFFFIIKNKFAAAMAKIGDEYERFRYTFAYNVILNSEWDERVCDSTSKDHILSSQLGFLVLEFSFTFL